MPIGKSAIKRVSSAGYANLKNEAPDMENSVVAVEEKSAPVQNKTAAKPTAKKAEAKPAAKKAEAKPTAKKAEAKPAAKKAEAKPTAKKAEAKPAAKKAATKPEAKKPAVKKPAKTEEKADVKASVLPRGAETAVMITESFKANEPESKGYYNLGDDMPVYLL